jgi:hypothetical protein
VPRVASGTVRAGTTAGRGRYRLAMAQLDLQRIQALVEEAIDSGASTVAEIHKAVAAAPLEVLEQIEPLSAAAGTAREISDWSIGAVYDAIRQVNEQVGVFAEELLRTRSEASGS